MMGLAIWHYTIFLPDRFWGGIVGAFLGAIVGAIVIGFAIYAAKSGVLGVPGRNATHLVTVLYAGWASCTSRAFGASVRRAELARRESSVSSPA